MSELIWENITYNLEDALDALKKLDESISSGNKPDEVEFRIGLQHIFHHLNFAWNTRHVSIEKHAGMTEEQFNQWGKFPEDLMW